MDHCADQNTKMVKIIATFFLQHETLGTPSAPPPSPPKKKKEKNKVTVLHCQERGGVPEHSKYATSTTNTIMSNQADNQTSTHNQSITKNTHKHNTQTHNKEKNTTRKKLTQKRRMLTTITVTVIRPQTCYTFKQSHAIAYMCMYAFLCACISNTCNHIHRHKRITKRKRVA